MPEISRFYGIVIEMRYNDHAPPHFHARCGRQVISIDIGDGTVTGEFPKAKLKLVLRWLALHLEELRLNWQLIEDELAPRYIEPLE